jgi:hypothetical protein
VIIVYAILVGNLCLNICLSGFLTSKSYFCWHWSPPLGQAPFHFVVHPILTRKDFRRLKTSTPTKAFSLICSAGLSTSSVGLKSTPRCHLLRL